MGDKTNIKIGTNKVTFNGVDLGFTKGGETFNYEVETVDITADKYGNTPLDKAIIGEMVSVTVNLTEWQIGNFKVAIPAGSVAGDTDKKLTLGREAGYRLSTDANELILRPERNVDGADPSEDIVIHQAVSSEPVEIGMNNDDQLVFEVTFTGLIDTTKSNGNHLAFIGDSTD